MADQKTSQLPIMAGDDLVATDRVVVLDRSRTTGPGSGPDGTLVTLEASRVAPFGTTKGIVHNLFLLGISTNQELFTWVAEAINTYGPYEGENGEDMYFRTYQVSGPQNDSVTIMYFKLLSGRLLAGGAGNTISPSELVLSGGPWIINGESNADLFLEIGDAGAGPIHTYFNLGEDGSISGDPWEITTQVFLTGILDGNPTIWHFLRGPGNYGGDGGMVTVADDFVNLSLQPPALGFTLTKVIPLSLAGINTMQDELTYIAAAVAQYGPFTCLPGQQMVFKTVTATGGSVNDPNPYQIISIRYYRLVKNLTRIGGPDVDGLPPSYFMPDGQGRVLVEDVDDALVAELGDISTGPVEDYFNLGEETAPSVFEPWDMNIKRFVRAELDGDITLWAFVGEEGLYGPDDLEATAADFFNITEQGNVVGDGDNVIKTISVLNTDLDTVDAAGLETYFNELDPGVLKQSFESWRINIVNASDVVLKTFDLVNRGKGPVGAEAIAYDPLNALEAAMFFEINKRFSDIDPDTDIYDDFDDLIANQNEQENGEEYYVTDATDFGIEGGALVLYLGTTAGDETDYLILSGDTGIPDGSITEAKLHPDVIAEINGKVDYSDLQATVTPDTGTTVDMSNVFGNNCNTASANTNSELALTNLVPGGCATVKVNRATETTIAAIGGVTITKLPANAFIASTDMDMHIYCRTLTQVDYYFLKRS